MKAKHFRGSVAIEALVLVLIAIAMVASGYRWGAHATDNAWQAKEAKRLQNEKTAHDAEQLRGEKASGALQAQLLDEAITNDQLQGAFNAYKRKHPLLVAPARVGPVGPAAGEQAAPIGSFVLPARLEPVLTYGAVWMWNSALLGRDAPAGACGLADTSEAACAADAGLSLEDAWDNQALNARICAEDRTRHQRLIDFLKGRK
jgi:hypothetical protein